MTLKQSVREHDAGTMTHFSTADEQLVVEIESDQFSIAFPTHRTWIDFAMAVADAHEKSRFALIPRSGKTIEGYGYNLRELGNEAGAEDLRPLLVRFWLDELSIAWQRLPGPEPEGPSISLLALASSSFDEAEFLALFGWGAAEPLLDEADELRDALTELLKKNEIPSVMHWSLAQVRWPT
jgi:hypothetical protein